MSDIKKAAEGLSNAFTTFIDAIVDNIVQSGEIGEPPITDKAEPVEEKKDPPKKKASKGKTTEKVDYGKLRDEVRVWIGDYVAEHKFKAFKALIKPWNIASLDEVKDEKLSEFFDFLKEESK